MKADFYNRVHSNPIIAAITEVSQLEKALQSPCEIIFLLKSDIFNIGTYVDRVKSSGKGVYVHVDLIDGLSKDALAIKYIHENIHPDGIITTKTGIVKAAKALNMFVIQRLFMLDHLSFETGLSSLETMKPNAVELLPGIMPKIINKFHKSTNIPLIAGGLIMDKEDVMLNLKAGATAISSSCEEVWYM